MSRSKKCWASPPELCAADFSSFIFAKRFRVKSFRKSPGMERASFSWTLAAAPLNWSHAMKRSAAKVLGQPSAPSICTMKSVQVSTATLVLKTKTALLSAIFSFRIFAICVCEIFWYAFSMNEIISHEKKMEKRKDDFFKAPYGSEAVRPLAPAAAKSRGFALNFFRTN